MTRTLYLLDGMALVYRAHFALIKAPIFTSAGLNTSALYGFTNTVLDLLDRQPAMLAIATDTAEPTDRHRIFPAYKAQREDMPEDIASALPHIDRIAAALGIPLLRYPGYEADDIMGTLAVAHAGPDLEVVLVTPDKDFAQLVRPHVTILKPGRQGKDAEILGVDAVKAQWEVPDPARVADVLGLWGDASDNIPGVPGFGEKTAKKLIAQFGSLEGIYDHLADLSAKQREKLEAHREQAFLCRRLATINTAVPVRESLDDLRVQPRRDEALRALCVEFEFNSIGRRLFGADFKAGRGSAPPRPSATQGELFAPAAPAEPPPAPVALKTIHDVPHTYRLIDRDDEVAALVEELGRLPRFCFDIETDRLNPKLARVAGIAFSWERGHGVYVRIPRSDTVPAPRLALLAPILQRPGIEKIGHNLKFDMGVLLWNGVEVHGPVFDTMIAHALLEPDRRHGMDALSEQYLGYTPIPFDDVVGAKGPTQTTMFDAPAEQVAEYAAEDADVTWQLHGLFADRLREAGLDRVFREIEMPLLPVLLRMEKAGIRLDRATLATTSTELAAQLLTLETRIHDLAGGPFNINSPRQLGEVLFERMALGGPKAKKTRTGQYATDESILSELATEHEIARRLLEYREAAKLKSTYVDALPETVFPPTGRIHTTFMPTGAVTGRLASVNPNLQNIPIRTEAGQGIRAAFLPTEGWQLLSADYSQIELRVMASLSGDPGMIDAFARGLDIHAATAARVYRVELDQVTADMRRTAKMVNFGIIYGISAFGLAQRLGIPRSEAASIIQQYFVEYPGVKAYMEQIVATCRTTGYVETMTGRRRWIRDITSANGTVRAAAERTAINTPIQGTAADMIKIAMVRIDTALRAANLRTTMLLQVHDELVFDLAPGEEDAARALIVRGMKDALPLNVPVEVQTGIGATWLAAHG